MRVNNEIPETGNIKIVVESWKGNKNCSRGPHNFVSAFNRNGKAIFLRSQGYYLRNYAIFINCCLSRASIYAFVSKQFERNKLENGCYIYNGPIATKPYKAI